LTTVPGEADAAPRAYRTLVVDDHPVVRRGLVAVLSVEEWVGEILEADSAAAARRLATTGRPDVAVVDLGLPDGDGLELIRYLRTTVPDCGLLVMTMTNDPGTVQAALDAGARGYLLKETAPEVLVAGLRTVAAGGQALGPAVRSGGRSGDGLTDRERQLLSLLARGLPIREMARRLGLSEKTVRNQLSLLTVKIGVADRVQAALWAARHGIG
jgi:two-component system nitrate/nitrite response regulator NarL